MALITRIARLFKADVHALLDSLEDPESVLKQALRDMTAEIEGAERALEELKRREARLASRLAEQVQLRVEALERIELCFRAGDDLLARSMVRRKLEVERRIKLAEREQGALAAAREKLTQELAAKRTRLASIRDQMEALADEDRARTPEEEVSLHGIAISDQDVEVAFLAEKARRAKLPLENG